MCMNWSPRGCAGSFLSCPTQPPSTITEWHRSDPDVGLQDPTIMRGQEDMRANSVKDIVSSCSKRAALGPAFSSNKWGRYTAGGPQHHVLAAIKLFSPAAKITQGWPVGSETGNIVPRGHFRSAHFIPSVICASPEYAGRWIPELWSLRRAIAERAPAGRSSWDHANCH
jgi:hypothetical protein